MTCLYLQPAKGVAAFVEPADLVLLVRLAYEKKLNSLEIQLGDKVLSRHLRLKLFCAQMQPDSENWI